MSIYHKFQDIFNYLLEAPDRETGDKKIEFEQMMTADFIGTLNNIRNADTRAEGDAILEAAIAGKHERFAEELTAIKNAPKRNIGNREIDSLLVLMNEYAATLVSIKDAQSREDGDVIIKNCLI